MAKSYAKVLQEQFKPQATNLMAKLFENLEEKLKNPNSIEFRTLAAFIVLVASKQFLEKTIQHTLSLIRHAEDQMAKLSHKAHSAGKTEADLSAEEREQQANHQVRSSTLRTLLAETVSQLGVLEGQRKQLTDEYQLQLQNLKTIYEPQIKQAIEQHLQIPVSDNQLKDIHDLYQQRAEKKPEMIATMKKVGAIPELSEADEKSNSRINANLDMGTQIILASFLKQAAQILNPTATTPVPMNNLLRAVNNTHGVAHLYQQVISTFSKDHEKAMDSIHNAESPLRQLVSALSKELNVTPTPSPSTYHRKSAEEDAKQEDVRPTKGPRLGG